MNDEDEDFFWDVYCAVQDAIDNSDGHIVATTIVYYLRKYGFDVVRRPND